MRALLLAAGASRRAGGAKALFADGDRSYLERTLDTLLAAELAEVIVVIARPWGEAIRERIGSRTRVRCVENHAPEAGMLWSVRVGLAEIPLHEPVLVALVDHPAVRPGTVRRLADALAAVPAKDALVVPRFAGRRGHPIALGPITWRRLRDDSNAGSLRDALRSAAHVVELDVDDPAVLEDRDGPPSGIGDGRPE